MSAATRVTLACIASAVLVFAASLAAQQSADVALRAAIETETIKGDVNAAIDQYQRLSNGSNRAVAAQALVRLAGAYQRRGNAEAQKVYERVVRDFADQREAAAAARTGLQAMRPTGSVMGQTARQVWTGDDVGGSGTLTADGRYMSVQVPSTGDLAIRDLVANTTRKVTDTGGWAASGDYTAQSVVSADGRQVVYHWFVEQDAATELRLVSIDASQTPKPRVLLRVEKNGYVVPVGLTPDGSQAVVVKTLPDRTNQLGLVSTANGTYRSIKSLEWRYPRGVSLSPDGRYIAYDVPVGDAGSPRDILLLRLDGGAETTAISGPGDDLRPVWTADGSRLVFTSTRGGNLSIWTVGVAEGRAVGPPALVKGNTGAVIPIGASRAGALVYWLPGGSRRNIYSAPIEDLKVTRAPTLATDQFVDESSGPSWSPDGQLLAFYSFRGRPTLVIRGADGAERTVAVPSGLEAPFFTGPRWFPDGRSVLVLAADPQGAGRGFYRVNVETGAADRLNHTDRRISSYALSPDGRSIYWSVQSVTSGTMDGELTRYDIAENRETILKRNEWFIAVAVSPDGSQLAYLKTVRSDADRRNREYPSIVEIIPTAGGPARQVFRDPTWLSGHRYNTLNWTPDGRHLMFVREDGRLWRIPAGGGAPQDMGLSVKGRVKAPAIHPDGTRIVFGTAEADNNEFWALENFLPALNATR